LKIYTIEISREKEVSLKLNKLRRDLWLEIMEMLAKGKKIQLEVIIK